MREKEKERETESEKEKIKKERGLDFGSIAIRLDDMFVVQRSRRKKH